MAIMKWRNNGVMKIIMANNENNNNENNGVMKMAWRVENESVMA